MDLSLEIKFGMINPKISFPNDIELARPIRDVALIEAIVVLLII